MLFAWIHFPILRLADEEQVHRRGGVREGSTLISPYVVFPCGDVGRHPGGWADIVRREP